VFLFPVDTMDFLFSTAFRSNMGHTQLLFSGYWGDFSRGKSCCIVKLISHIHLVSKTRNVELYIRSYIRLHGVVLKEVGENGSFYRFDLFISPLR
jgi:hypothetical protein